MAKYIAKRVALAIVTLLVLTSVVFVLVRLMPGDPFSSDKMTPEIKANLEAYYGLDKPLAEQYITYMKNVLHGDLGYSMKYESQTVNRIIADSFPYSADLGIRSLCFALFFGLILGIVAALNRGKKLDFVCILIAIIGTSIPDFIMGSVLQYFFGIKWQILPVAQYTSFKHTILPSIAVGFYTLASISRLMRSSMLEVIRQDYIRTARSKGIANNKVIYLHALKNALIPVITILGMRLGNLIAGSMFVESVFNIPGMGSLMVKAIQSRDIPVVQACVLAIALVSCIVNLATDILYAVVDPRVRFE